MQDLNKKTCIVCNEAIGTLISDSLDAQAFSLGKVVTTINVLFVTLCLAM